MAGAGIEPEESGSQNPAGLQLRYLQTLGDLGVNQNTTVVFPVPMELMKAFAPAGNGRLPGAS